MSMSVSWRTQIIFLEFLTQIKGSKEKKNMCVWVTKRANRPGISV